MGMYVFDAGKPTGRAGIDIESTITEGLVELALRGQQVVKPENPFSLKLVAEGNIYSGLRNIVQYLGRVIPPPQNPASCKRSREMIVDIEENDPKYPVSDNDRESLYQHLLQNCNDCIGFIKTSTVLHKSAERKKK